MLRDKDYEFLKFAFLKAFIPASIRYVKSDYSDELNVYCEINNIRVGSPEYIREFFGYNKYEKFYEQCMRRYGCDLPQAFPEVLKAMGICSQYIFDVHRVKGSMSIDNIINGNYRKSKYEIGSLQRVCKFAYKEITMQYIDEIRDIIFGKMLICYLKYECRTKEGIKRLWIPATYEFGYQTIGLFPIPAVCLNKEKIEQNNSKTIIFFASSEVALEWCLIDQYYKLLDDGGYIVSGVFDDRHYDDVDLKNALFGRKVIFVASHEDERLDGLKSIIKRLEDSTYLYIYPWLITEEPYSRDKFHGNSIMYARAEKNDYFSNLEDPVLLLKKIEREALSVDEYKKWRKAITTPEVAPGEASGELCLASMSEIMATRQMMPKQPLSWERLFSQSSYVMLWGPTNSYKSHVTAKIACGLAGGHEVFGLSTMGKHRVAYYDGENDEEALCEIIARVGENSSLENLLFQKAHMNLLKNKEKIFEDLRRQNVDIVIIDNVSSLIPEATHGGTGFYTDFAEELKKLGIAMLLVHHANKTGQARGDNTLENLCKTIFYVKTVGEGDLENVDDCFSNPVRQALQKGNAVVQLSVKKWKQGAWLPTLMLEHDENAQRFELLAGTWEKRAPEHFEQPITPDTESTPDFREQAVKTQQEMGKDASLSPDANKVLKAVEEGRSVSRQEIEDVTGLSKGKTIQCLSKLVSEKRLAKCGQGKGTYYTPITR